MPGKGLEVFIHRDVVGGVSRAFTPHEHWLFLWNAAQDPQILISFTGIFTCSPLNSIRTQPLLGPDPFPLKNHFQFLLMIVGIRRLVKMLFVFFKKFCGTWVCPHTQQHPNGSGCFIKWELNLSIHYLPKAWEELSEIPFTGYFCSLYYEYKAMIKLRSTGGFDAGAFSHLGFTLKFQVWNHFLLSWKITWVKLSKYSALFWTFCSFRQTRNYLKIA